MPEYRRTEHGLPQRVWPSEKRQQLGREGLRIWLPTSEEGGRVEFKRAPGEPDRGSYAYRIIAIKDAMKKYSHNRQQQPVSLEDGWY